jgi:integrase
MKRTATPPKYRHYRPKNLAVVRIDGRDHYLGRYDSPESREAYHRLLAEHAAGSRPAAPAPTPRRTPASLTINQLVNAYRQHAEGYYVRDGKQTKELADMRYACRPLRELYGSTLVADFGPLALKAVRQHMIGVENLSRGVANHRTNRIKRVFKWGVSEELVPSAIFEGLRTVDGLRFGRCNARETEPVKPVPWAYVEPVVAAVSAPVAAMIRLQCLTAMRPCEVVQMRAAEIDMSGDVWLYEPLDHKNRWRGHQRLIPLGPKAQDIIRPFLDLKTNAFLFSPQEAERRRNELRRATRKTPMTPSQRKRKRKKSPKRAKRERYDVDAYRRAITYGVEKVNRKRPADQQIPHWFPLQLRHARATEVRKTFGLEGAQVLLGHARADVTQVYAERNAHAALRIAREIG